MMMNCSCENCGRSNDVVEIEKLTIRGHIADLCLTCAHVLSYNEPNFFSLVRGKSEQQSNSEMKKVHAMLSTLLMVGMFFIVIVAAYGVAQYLPSFPGEAVSNDTLKQQSEYVSFYLLNQLK